MRPGFATDERRIHRIEKMRIFVTCEDGDLSFSFFRPDGQPCRPVKVAITEILDWRKVWYLEDAEPKEGASLPTQGPFLYGRLPAGYRQLWPEIGAPTALRPGVRYHISALESHFGAASFEL